MRYLFLLFILSSCGDDSLMFTGKNHLELKENPAALNDSSNSSVNKKWQEHLDNADKTWNDANGGVPYDFKGSKAATTSDKGNFILNLGNHEIEYFADRMVVKAKKAGYEAKKTSFVFEGKKFFKASIGPFNSLSEAKEAEGKIKSLVPDLPSSIIKNK